MNDVKAPRNAQSRSPRRRASNQPDGSDQLGELEFADWYETPVFEPDEDELMEEAATSGRGPRRLMARMVLARDARKALRRPQWDEAPSPPAARKQPAPRPAPAPAAAKTPTEPVAKIPAKPTAATTPTKPAAEKAPTEPVPSVPPAPAAATTTTIPAAATTATNPAAATTTTKPVAKIPPPAATAPAEPAVAKTPTEPVPTVPAAPAAATTTPTKSPTATTTAKPPTPAMPQDRWSDWATSGPSMDEQTMQQDLDRDSWRRRIDSFLDRWAAAEVAVAARLDQSIEKVLNSSEPRSISSLLSARRNDSD